ncbi:MarR family transcriptional regulator [Thermoleophilia bacterium SCSIO 60948]|nr:MarR family transcriptional regulator [Thermoleophilia bacterium SCSIO 60948]
MSTAAPARDANMLGALLLAGGDALRGAVEEGVSSAASAPGALVALAGLARDSTIGELGEVVGLGHSGTVRLVDRLESEQLVTRARDGRTVSVRLTRRGRDLARRITRRRGEVLSSILAPLEPAERDRLGDLLERLLAAMPERRADLTRVCRLCDTGACGRGEGRCPIESLETQFESQDDAEGNR